MFSIKLTTTSAGPGRIARMYKVDPETRALKRPIPVAILSFPSFVHSKKGMATARAIDYNGLFTGLSSETPHIDSSGLARLLSGKNPTMKMIELRTRTNDGSDLYDAIIGRLCPDALIPKYGKRHESALKAIQALMAMDKNTWNRIKADEFDPYNIRIDLSGAIIGKGHDLISGLLSIFWATGLNDLDLKNTDLTKTKFRGIRIGQPMSF